MSYLQFQQLHYRAFFIPINSFQLTIKLIEIRDNIFVISIPNQNSISRVYSIVLNNLSNNNNRTIYYINIFSSNQISRERRSK